MWLKIVKETIIIIADYITWYGVTIYFVVSLLYLQNYWCIEKTRNEYIYSVKINA